MGNEALANNMESGEPVRLLRFIGDVPRERSYTGKLYSYDGLYRVADHKLEAGAREHAVFKFKLVRCEGQPPLRSNASARMHQRLIALAVRDGSAHKRHLQKEDEQRAAKKKAKRATMRVEVQAVADGNAEE